MPNMVAPNLRSWSSDIEPSTIEQVMADQQDLVEVQDALPQVFNYRG